MLKKIFSRLYIERSVIAIFAFAVLIIAGCMETITPTDKTASTLTVKMYIVVNNDTTKPFPLVGDSIRVFDVNDKKVPLFQGLTNAEGQIEFPMNVPKLGQNLYVTARHGDTTKFTFGFLICVDTTISFRFDTSGCKSTCPSLEVNGVEKEFGIPLIQDIVADKPNGRTLVSTSSLSRTVLTATYRVSNSDSACFPIDVNINVIDSILGKQYSNARLLDCFKVFPTSVTLNPGQFQDIEITFSAPTRSELDSMIKTPQKNNDITDSTLAIRVNFTVNGRSCSQDLELKAVMIVVPDLSPVINLRAFKQYTKQVPVPDNEVYYFGRLDKDILRHADKTPIYTEDPLLGDIWLDVPVNDTTVAPPQAPMLKLCPISTIIGMKVWKSNYSQYNFVTIFPVLNEFTADPARGSGYSRAAIDPIKPGDVVAFQFDNSTYALVYIRAVEDGSNNMSEQSAIEFRALYPVIAP